MGTKKMLLLMAIGVLSVLVIVVYVATQNDGSQTPPSEIPSAEQAEDVSRQYEGTVVFVSQERDLIHVLERDGGLVAVSIPTEMRSEFSTLEDGSTIVLVGTVDDGQNPDLLRLQQVLSIESGGELTPADSARLNSEFRGLRL